MPEMKNTTQTDFKNIENLYQRMIEEIEDYAIIILDENGIIKNWNRGAEKIKYYRQDEIIGKHFSTFYFEEDIDRNVPKKLLEIARSMGKASLEGWRKRKDGSKFWGNVTITAIHNDNNIVVGFCKVTRDLTDRKLAEDELRKSEERYHQMIAEVQDYAIILLDANGIIQNWNIGAEKIKGYTSTEVIGKRFELFYTEEDLRIGLPGKLLLEAKTKGKALQEGWRVRKDGTKFWGTIVITALHNKENQVIGFSKVTRDLTQQKIAEDKLACYLTELEIQNSELEQFAYVASHDLQEPLRKIQTFAELIQENIEDRNFVRKYFEKLDLSAKRMSELVKSLMTYSHISDKKELAFSNVDLNIVLEEVKVDLELLISEKSAIIYNEPLPVIYGNNIQVGQLFSNFISNSLKFSTEKPVIRITSSVVNRREIDDAPKKLRPGLYHKIVFEDNGIGFDKQYSELIFTLFQRLHGKHEYAGTGIGLALCKRIVENHNGFIVGVGDPGKGAKFTIYLPQ